GAESDAAVEYPVDIPLLPPAPALGDLLGHRQGKAVGGKDQADVVDLISCIVVSDSLIPQNPGHGNLVKQPDQPDHNARRRQNTPLHQVIVIFLAHFASTFRFSYVSSQKQSHSITGNGAFQDFTRQKGGCGMSSSAAPAVPVVILFHSRSGY